MKIPDIMKAFGLTKSMSTDLIKSYLALSAAAGVIGGAGLGVVSSYTNKKNPEITALNRKKKYYDAKVEEMDNENWLNDIMSIKKKLDTGRITPEERKELEKKYLKLLNR